MTSHLLYLVGMKKSLPQAKPEPSPTQRFVSMGLDMTWRLAIVVLVPIVGGFELDRRLETTPVFTVVGFFLAMGGMALVMWQTLQKANEATSSTDSKQEKDK